MDPGYPVVPVGPWTFFVAALDKVQYDYHPHAAQKVKKPFSKAGNQVYLLIFMVLDPGRISNTDPYPDPGQPNKRGRVHGSGSGSGSTTLVLKIRLRYNFFYRNGTVNARIENGIGAGLGRLISWFKGHGWEGQML